MAQVITRCRLTGHYMFMGLGVHPKEFARSPLSCRAQVLSVLCLRSPVAQGGLQIPGAEARRRVSAFSKRADEDIGRPATKACADDLPAAPFTERDVVILALAAFNSNPEGCRRSRCATKMRAWRLSMLTAVMAWTRGRRRRHPAAASDSARRHELTRLVADDERASRAWRRLRRGRPLQRRYCKHRKGPEPATYLLCSVLPGARRSAPSWASSRRRRRWSVPRRKRIRITRPCSHARRRWTIRTSRLQEGGQEALGARGHLTQPRRRAGPERAAIQRILANRSAIASATTRAASSPRAVSSPRSSVKTRCAAEYHRQNLRHHNLPRIGRAE